jgi:leucyl aminopeptidase
MIKKENFAKAYKEIDVIIGHLNEEEKNKIPKEFIEMIESKMDKDYVFNYDATKSLDEQEVLRETLSILAYIYVNYIGEYDEVKQIKAQFQKDIIQHEVAKKALYEKNNPNGDMRIIRNNTNTAKDIKQANNNTVNPEKFEQEVSLMDSKQDKWYSKIVSFFKNIFK